MTIQRDGAPTPISLNKCQLHFSTFLTALILIHLLMETPNFFLLSLLTVLLISAHLPTLSFSAKERCNPDDKKVLLKIKKDLGNPYALASWQPDTDCCTWYVSKCDPTTHRITILDVQYDDNLTSQIPSAVGDLPFLQVLIFHKLPHLTGTIPDSITKLKYLSYLWITWTNISGPVPDFIGRIKSLTYINLSFNNLTGPIPSSLASPPSLGYLDLSRNHITGSIPDTFGSFAASQGFTLILSHNQLSGPVPESLGNGVLSRVDLSRNKLTGDVSFLFGPNKTDLFDVDLSRNELGFDFSKVVFPNNTTLQYVDLNHNQIYGSLPESLTILSNLQLFNVSYNMLCGQIPVGGNLQSFDQNSYFHNKCLCGAPLPACK